MDILEGIHTYNDGKGSLRPIKDLTDKEEIFDNIFDKGKSGVIFSGTGMGKTTLLGRMVYKSNDRGIIRNNFIGEFGDLSFDNKLNVVAFDKRAIQYDSFADLSMNFNV